MQNFEGIARGFMEGRLRPTPSTDPEHAAVNALISRCLSVDPAKRPSFKDIHSQLVGMAV